MADAVSPSVLELLGWVSEREPTYLETMNAWRTSCPRSSAWEDALEAGLVAVVRNGESSKSAVALTVAGRAVLDANR